MNKLRRFLVIGVMVLTVVTMSGVLVTPVKAAASAGDLIKMSGLSSVYYLGNDGKRYVFPNEATYFSWYNDFSSVVTIPASELQSYPLGGNVTMRPGTKMVKITTDPSVYAVEPNGVLRKIQSEAQAAALYGSNWNKRIVDIADSFFTNYTISSALVSGQFPVGSLVKNTGNASIYYFDGTNYRMIANEAAFNANRFQFSNVLTASNTITAGGSNVTSAEFVNVAQNPTGPVTTASGLMVSLSATTPAAISVPKNGVRVPMTKVNLTAASDGAVTVNSITVKRIGLSSYNDVDKVWAEKDGVLVASKKSMNSNDEAILVFSPALTINAGQTASIELIASLTGTGTGNIGLGIASASGVSATAATVSGSFPVNGNIMSLVAYDVAKLAISSSTVSSTVKVGDEKVELGKFTVEFNTTVAAKDVNLKSITLKNNGVEDLSKATMNLYLENAGNKVSTSYTIDGRFVTFYFGANGFDLLKDDSSKIFSIKGDVIAKENTATNSFSFSLNKSTDLVGVEKNTGFGVNTYTTTGGSTLADNYLISNITIDAGAVAVTKKSTSPSDTTIVKGSDNTVLIANVRADEAITADGLNLTYGTGDSSTTTNQFENVRVYINGILLDSFDPAAYATHLQAIDSTVNLNKGDNEVKVVVRAKTTASAGARFQVILSGNNLLTNMNPEYVISGNTVSGSMSGTATGGIFTVQGAALTTVRSDGYAANKTIVKGTSDVSLGKFTVKATNDTAKITSVSLGANLGTTSATNISDMKLFVDGTQVGNTVDFGSTGATFSSLNVDIAKDSTRNIEILGSFDSSAAGSFQTVMTLNAQDSRGTSIATGNVATTTTFVVADNGTLTVDLGGNTPAEGMLASKSTEQEVAQFKFTAVNDSANITEINVINTAIGSTTIASTSAGVADADARIAAIKLYDGSTLLDSFVPVSGAGKFTLNNNQVVIAANTAKTLSIKVVLNDIVNDATATDKDLHLGLTTLKFKSSAGAVTTQGVAKLANNFRIRKTVPTVAYQELSDKVLNAGDKTIAKFTVAADANGDVTVGRFALTISNTASATIATTTNPLKVNGATKTATASISGSQMTILLATPEVIAAGTSKTFEVIATVGVSGNGSESITAKIVEDATYSTNATLGSVSGNFAWSDGASISDYTWANGKRVPGLTTTTWVLSK